MSLQDLKRRAHRENVLMTVMLELTYKCNLDCFYCYNDRDIGGTPLSADQYFRLLQDLREMQVMDLILTGGEPLAHPSFFAIGAMARELGFVVRVKTNGHALNRRLAGRMKREVDPYVLEISLHGATATTHDRQTRVAGSFDRLLSNLRVLRDFGLRYKLNATVTRWNEHEIEAMYELADRHGALLRTYTSVTPRDNGDTSPLGIAPSEEAIGRAFAIGLARAGTGKEDWLNKTRSSLSDNCAGDDPGVKQCGAGSTAVTIDPVGNILPCVQWRRPLGNVHENDIRTLWKDSKDLAEVRETSFRARQFVEGFGPGGRLMSYCIGESVAQTGEPIALYPIARRQMDSRLDIVIKP